jgi:hypothetical protein
MYNKRLKKEKRKMSIIKGYVIDRFNDLRVPFCAVDLYRVGEKSAFVTDHTDANGEFEFTVPSGSYTLMFMGPGYEPVAESIEIEDDMEQRYKLETEKILLM